jgi:hypothetical protein
VREDLQKKVIREEVLTPTEMFDLELGLDDQAERGLALLVKKGVDLEPSLAWRSSLNERLSAMAPTARQPWWKRKPVLWTAVPAAAVCLLAALAFQLRPAALPTPEPTASKDVETTLVMIHRVSSSAEDTGVVMPMETAQSYQWSDLEAF